MEMLASYSDDSNYPGGNESDEDDDSCVQKNRMSTVISNIPELKNSKQVDSRSNISEDCCKSSVGFSEDKSKKDDKSYFGLFAQSDTDSSDDQEKSTIKEEPAEKKSKLSKFFKPLVKEPDRSDGPDVPDGIFWKKADGVINWSNPAQIWTSHDQTQEHSASNANYPQAMSSNIDNTDRSSSSKPTETNKKLKKSCFFIHHKIGPLLNQDTSKRPGARVPKKCSVELAGHAGAVNRIKWCHANYSHLLVSVSMDKLVKVWNTMSSENPLVQTFSYHTKAVKDAKWSHDGRQILTCGYDRTSRLLDVDTGSNVRQFEEDQYVFCVAFHPVQHSLFLSGSTNRLSLWDARRRGSAVRVYKYKDVFGQVQDVAFLRDGSTFFTCNDLVSRDSSDRNLMAWDFMKGVVTSGQMYNERYTCSRLAVHPTEPHLLAQSQGNYIAQFSTIRPYRLNKCKRYEGHKVQGYSVGFDVTSGGHTLASGSSDGVVTFYDYHTTRKISSLSLGNHQVCLDVAWHPLVTGCVATATWAGGVSVWR